GELVLLLAPDAVDPGQLLRALSERDRPLLGHLRVDHAPTERGRVHRLRDAWMAASRLDPHRRLIVVPGMLVGSPASSTAMRATLRLSSPAPLALPNMTSSIRSGSTALRSTSALTTCAPRSSGRTPARPPP